MTAEVLMLSGGGLTEHWSLDCTIRATSAVMSSRCVEEHRSRALACRRILVDGECALGTGVVWERDIGGRSSSSAGGIAQPASSSLAAYDSQES